jgi:hypothetical protein
MAIIAINDLNLAGHSLFMDGESYLTELISDDELNTYGGGLYFSSVLTFAGGVIVSVGLTIAAYAITRAYYAQP